ncbi:MAG: ribonuclease III [Sulfuriferula sp.]
MNVTAIERAIGYQFKRANLLTQAFTHRSFGIPHNERLEFLGDSVLNCAVAQLLYMRFPDLPEGVLSRLRANLVRQQSLFEIAERLRLGDFLRLGDGEIKSGGRNRPSILADALESIFGAVLLDSDFNQAQQVIHHLYAESIAAIDPNTPAKDSKTLLQEVLQGRHLPLPDYILVATSGQAHEQIFNIDCVVPALSIHTTGVANSRRAAEQAAALTAYQTIIANSAKNPEKKTTG